MADGLPLDRLEPWLAEHVPGFRGPLSISTFGVGQSNPTYRLESPSGAYVLRRRPPGNLLPSAHAVDREFRVISALAPTGFPVPHAWALCTETEVIGSIFYVMDLVDGRILKDGALPDLTPEQRGSIYYMLTDTIADLHRIEPDAVGLSDFGRPGNYYARQIERWTKQYRASNPSHLPAMEALIERLPLNVPDMPRICIVHGDFRLDNLVLSHDLGRVEAVLDWELSTLGDPLSDLAYFLLSWVMPRALSPNDSGFADHDPDALGIPSRQEIIARYAQRSGSSALTGIDWRIAFNLFRLAAIYQGIAARSSAGNAVRSDAASYGSRVAPLAELAVGLLDAAC
jgi:aminoglycoside phosphotransferase (APT) family kinase protein